MEQRSRLALVPVNGRKSSTPVDNLYNSTRYGIRKGKKEQLNGKEELYIFTESPEPARVRGYLSRVRWIIDGAILSIF